MRRFQDPDTKKWLKMASSQKEVTRYLWKYHEIATDIMKCGQSWYIYVNDKWMGCGTKAIDNLPIQRWAEIYKFLVKNPESNVSFMPFIHYPQYLIANSRDITIDHSKYKSSLI
jgi:hypothetical protein